MKGPRRHTELEYLRAIESLAEEIRYGKRSQTEIERMTDHIVILARAVFVERVLSNGKDLGV